MPEINRNNFIDEVNISAINAARQEGFRLNFDDDKLVREITQFCWLWPFFENCRLEKRAGQSTIKNFCIQRERSPLSGDELKAHQYFSDRYAPLGQTNDRFVALLADGTNDKMKSAIERGLVEPAGQEAIRKALVCIVYRLRNNLFHGNKASGDMNDQRQNFEHANTLLRTWLGQD